MTIQSCAPVPYSKENTLTPQEATLLLAAVISNFSWVIVAKQSWFKDD